MRIFQVIENLYDDYQPSLSHPDPGSHSLSAISGALSFRKHAANDDDTDLRHDGLEKSSAQTFISGAAEPDQINRTLRLGRELVKDTKICHPRVACLTTSTFEETT